MTFTVLTGAHLARVPRPSHLEGSRLYAVRQPPPHWASQTTGTQTSLSGGLFLGPREEGTVRADTPPGHLVFQLHFGRFSCLQEARPGSKLATALVGASVCELLAVGPSSSSSRVRGPPQSCWGQWLRWVVPEPFLAPQPAGWAPWIGVWAAETPVGQSPCLDVARRPSHNAQLGLVAEEAARCACAQVLGAFLICQSQPGVCKEFRAPGWAGQPVLRITGQKRASSLSEGPSWLVDGLGVTLLEQVPGRGLRSPGM